MACPDVMGDLLFGAMWIRQRISPSRLGKLYNVPSRSTVWTASYVSRSHFAVFAREGDIVCPVRHVRTHHVPAKWRAVLFVATNVKTQQKSAGHVPVDILDAKWTVAKNNRFVTSKPGSTY